MISINSDATWHAEKRPKPGIDIPVYLNSSEYCDGVTLAFGDTFKVTLSPKDAIEIGQNLLTLGGYLTIFSARFGVEERDATVRARD